MRRGLGWGARWMGGVAAVALLTHCGTGESGQAEARSAAPTSRVEQALVTTVTFTPSADAVARRDSPEQNFGSEETLSVDQSPEESGYLRFNVTGLTGTVTHARLRLYVTDSTTDGPRLYGTRNWDWQESTLTWYRSPYASEQQLLEDKAALSSGTWADFNVSAAVHGDGDYTFILEATSADGVDFASRENSRADRRPQLVLTVDSEPTCLPRVYTKTRTEQPYGDTSVSEAQPTQRFGSESVLLVDSNPTRLESYLFFSNEYIYDLDAWNVKRATVRLFATEGTSNGPRVHTTQGGWSWPSYDFDWNTRPTVVGPPLADLGAISANTWVEADVTSVAARQRGALFFGLLSDSGDGVDFVSANAAAAERHPQLRVELESGPYCTYRGTAGGRTSYTRHYGGAGDERLMALSADSHGGLVAAGRFGDAPFPEGTGFALAHYDAAGRALWTRQVTTANVHPQSLTVTPEGNILVVGTYSGAPDLGTGALTTVPGSWAAGTFIAKFSPSGQPVWSHGFVATYFYVPDQQLQYWPVQAAAVATDAQGSLIVTGNFHGEVDFGGGVLFAGRNSVYSEDAYPGSFIAKFDWRGQHVWSRATEGAASEPTAETRAVSTDNAGNVFVAGRANSGADLGDGQPIAWSSPYLAKYDGATGALQWKRVFQGPSWVFGEVIAVRPLPNGDVAFGANLGGTFRFGGGTYTGGDPSDQGYPENVNGFTGTLSATGGDKALRDLKETRLQNLVATSDDTYTVSGFGTNVDLGGGVVGPDAYVSNSAFVARYTATGAHLWSRSLEPQFTGDDYGPRMLLAPTTGSDVLLGGDFAQPFQHDGVTYTPRGASDLFYLRLTP
ncbi:CBM96 family carbohydrate-binding protein [Cystobacter fuscus]|uniref:CBM96 family carbohydrate-binding protein n=1 Tax=Cystobacter fuscus TaxID=43 RepID=UPI00138B014E|nr:DNRLRE domain-containing protein [Cystobacter fuscus]